MTGSWAVPRCIVDLHRVERLWGAHPGFLRERVLFVAAHRCVLLLPLCVSFSQTGQVIARQMVKQGKGGAIVNMSSVNGVMALPTIPSYNAAKGGINNLTRNMALNLAPHGIRVNAVGPGSIVTEVLREVLKEREQARAALCRIPQLRFGESIEVGNVVKFLASEDASYVTGQILYVDGGRMALNYTVPVPEEKIDAFFAGGEQ